MDPDSNHSSSLPSPEPATAGTSDAPIGPPIDVGTPTPVIPAANPGPTPEEAADNDRIEQEWVIKTKQVLLATRNDPYEQARQLAALRADYMLKRYNKEIKQGN